MSDVLINYQQTTAAAAAAVAAAVADMSSVLARVSDEYEQREAARNVELCELLMCLVIVWTSLVNEHRLTAQH